MSDESYLDRFHSCARVIDGWLQVSDVQARFLERMQEWWERRGERDGLEGGFFPARKLALCEAYARLLAIHRRLCKSGIRLHPWYTHNGLDGEELVQAVGLVTLCDALADAEPERDVTISRPEQGYRWNHLRLQLLACLADVREDLAARLPDDARTIDLDALLPAAPIPDGHRLQGDRDGDGGEAVDDLVTLSQAAALINKTKRTLEGYLRNGELPEPSIRGGNGKANYWRWSELRPALTRYRADLPEKFPGSRILD